MRAQLLAGLRFPPTPPRSLRIRGSALFPLLLALFASPALAAGVPGQVASTEASSSPSAQDAAPVPAPSDALTANDEVPSSAPAEALASDADPAQQTAPDVDEAPAAAPANLTPADAPDEGFWLGDRYRYGRAGLLERFGRDLIAIPANIVRWDGTDWGVFLSMTTIVGTMMVPFDDSPDVWFQKYSRANIGDWRNYTWGPWTDGIVWGGIFVAMGSTFLVGHFDDRPVLLEATSLMSEAFMLGQISQFLFKFALGREGPEDGDGTGQILGPAHFFRLFPSGTPSGHAMTFFALMGAMNTYVDDWRLTAAMVPVGLLFAFTLVISEYHFASDVVWGAAMGYALGTWVVNHRRSNRPLPRKGEQDLWQWLVMPTVNPQTGSAGAALTVVF